MKKILLTIVAVFIGILLVGTPVYAKCVNTSILGNSACDKDGNFIHNGNPTSSEYSCSCDDNNGSSIMHILSLVVNIMSVGIGILGVIGISVSGVQYLTAGGNEDQTRKAKRRIFEIVIGLAVYVLIYALLYWLLPGFNGVQNP